MARLWSRLEQELQDGPSYHLRFGEWTFARPFKPENEPTSHLMCSF